MKRMNQIYVLGFSLLLSGVACAADMSTNRMKLSSVASWTEEERVLGEELIEIAYGGYFARIEEILTQNPSLAHFKDNEGVTALMRAAAYRGKIEIVDRLLAAHADVNAQDKAGWDALMRAAYRGHAEIMDKLIDARADVNAKDKHNWCALMWAARQGHTEAVQALLDARAHSAIPNNDRKTALEYAQEKGHSAIVEILQNHVDIEPEEETLMVKPALSELME